MASYAAAVAGQQCTKEERHAAPEGKEEMMQLQEVRYTSLLAPGMCLELK